MGGEGEEERGMIFMLVLVLARCGVVSGFVCEEDEERHLMRGSKIGTERLTQVV